VLRIDYSEDLGSGNTFVCVCVCVCVCMLSSKDCLNCQCCKHHRHIYRHHCLQHMPNAYMAAEDEFSLATNEQEQLKDLYEAGLEKEAIIKDSQKVHVYMSYV